MNVVDNLLEHRLCHLPLNKILIVLLWTWLWSWRSLVQLNRKSQLEYLKKYLIQDSIKHPMLEDQLCCSRTWVHHVIPPVPSPSKYSSFCRLVLIAQSSWIIFFTPLPISFLTPCRWCFSWLHRCTQNVCPRLLCWWWIYQPVWCIQSLYSPG